AHRPVAAFAGAGTPVPPLNRGSAVRAGLHENFAWCLRARGSAAVVCKNCRTTCFLGQLTAMPALPTALSAVADPGAPAPETTMTSSPAGQVTVEDDAEP